MREESQYQALLDAYTERGYQMLALEAEVERLRRGIAAYREFRRRWQEDHTDGHEWVECLRALGLWEHEEAKRDER